MDHLQVWQYTRSLVGVVKMLLHMGDLVLLFLRLLQVVVPQAQMLLY